VRALRASRIVVDAEALRLRLQARRFAVRVVLAAVALVFLACALVLAHAAAWFWLRVSCDWMVQSTAAVLAVGDLVVAGVVGVVALRLGPGPAEIEARLLRRQAWQALVSTVAWPMILLRVLRLLRQR
jgi:uncharacterized membrane protein (DUF485 family)